MKTSPWFENLRATIYDTHCLPEGVTLRAMSANKENAQQIGVYDEDYDEQTEKKARGVLDV